MPQAGIQIFCIKVPQRLNLQIGTNTSASMSGISTADEDQFVCNASKTGTQYHTVCITLSVHVCGCMAGLFPSPCDPAVTAMQEQYTDALSQLQQLVQQQPSDYAALAQLLTLLRRVGRSQEGQGFLQTAQERAYRAPPLPPSLPYPTLLYPKHSMRALHANSSNFCICVCTRLSCGSSLTHEHSQHCCVGHRSALLPRLA